MRVLIFEDNLMWGPRLAKSVQAFGHEPLVIAKLREALPTGDLAIVNLGSLSMPASDLVPRLKAAGFKVLAHAGHKEKELHDLGRDLGCDRLATNSEITHKLEQILAEI
ncbi:MAG: hypothetical protein H7Y17_08555 [Chlorobia bacterium]|nr:hypothetical protein [Fimbriimonadaceae bacterium]